MASQSAVPGFAGAIRWNKLRRSTSGSVNQLPGARFNAQDRRSDSDVEVKPDLDGGVQPESELTQFKAISRLSTTRLPDGAGDWQRQFCAVHGSVEWRDS
jgi:hypothetical protein